MSLLVALGGTTAAIVGVGAIMPLITLVLLPAILGADARATVPIVQIGLLRSMPLFRPLPPPELEGVARAMEPLAAAAGDVIIREGEPGELYYAIADGEVTVSTAAGFTRGLDARRRLRRDRAAQRHAAHGDRLGNHRRRASTRSRATHFLTAVTGAPDVHRKARSLVEDRLAQLDAERRPPISRADPRL